MSDIATLRVVRRLILWLLILGLAGTFVELLLLQHYEDSWQVVPLFLIVLAFVIIGWHHASPSRMTLRTLRVTMGVFVAAGALGVLLHYQGSLEFQRDVDPGLTGWPLLLKVLRAKAPPVLAPGLMAQLGLLGLAYAYRDPAAAKELTP